MKVKICGVTRPAEALLAAELGADFLGLNFFPPSPRYLEPPAAAEIAAAVRERAAHVRLVGVFVNRPLDEVEDIADGVGLDLLQFHGDETAAVLRPVAARAIKAVRVAGRLDASAVADFDDVWGFLFDVRHPRLYGGSGESWDFSTLNALTPRARRKPTFIAGGLGPANVRAAVDACAPWGVDVCSGVEASPGRKDPELLRRLFAEIAVLRKERTDGQSPVTT
jgi:phosphoribosylanthranilate isomerase